MAKCPKCGAELRKPKKNWIYGRYVVQSYSCSCGTDFRDYARNKKHAFTLTLQKGKGFVKAKDA